MIIASSYFGYIDESGDVAPFSGSKHLVVSLLVTKNPRPIELHIKRTRKSLRRKARLDELKATEVEAIVSERLLRSIADEDIEIVSVIVNKQAILRPPADFEDIYREAVTRLIAHAVPRYPRLELWFDKRYTKPALRILMEKTIREGIALMPQQVVLIHQEDSRQIKGLQAVDHIAWAIYQKYEHADARFYQIFAEKIVIEDVVVHHLW